MWFWLLVAFLVGQASVEEVSPLVIPDPKTAAVWVSVVDENGHPVANAPVGLKEGIFFLTKDETSADGRFRFGGLSSGVHLVGVFNKRGYSSATEWIELKPGEEKEVTFVIQEKAFFGHLLISGDSGSW